MVVTEYAAYLKVHRYNAYVYSVLDSMHFDLGRPEDAARLREIGFLIRSDEIDEAEELISALGPNLGAT